jgi:putative heme-binding domain-containing protein
MTRLLAIAFTATLAAAGQDGLTLFQKHCSYCHGARGEGGRGPDLTTGRSRRAQNDQELFQVIRNGVRGTEMPAVRASDDEVRLLVAHVKSLVTRTDGRAGGDRTAGAAVFASHCAACHPGVGPDLRFASSRGAAFLRDSLLKPEAEIAQGFRALRITLRDGRRVVGVRLNEDDTSVQVREAAGTLRSIMKADIGEVDRSKPSLMPSFEKLTQKQLDDVVAYVMELP